MKSPSPYKIFFSFLKLGLTAFGGPAMVAYIRDLAVREKGWVSEKDFRHGVALVQTIPGATAMQAAAYAGLRAGGPAGALGAYTGFSLPAFLLMLMLTVAYRHGQDIPSVLALFAGLQVIVIAMVANATLNFGRKTLLTWQDVLLTIAGAAYIIPGGSPVTVILLSAAAGPVLYRNIVKESSETAPETRDDREKGKGKNTFLHPCFRFGILVTCAVLLMLLVLFFINDQLCKLGFIMVKIDLFAFGGGYASLPLMLHELAGARHLLDEKTLMDGIALGQVTPGPIVITATFAGYLLYGFTGAVIATICIFAPSFVILLLVTPWFDRLKNNLLFRRAIKGILCSFVGLLAAVTVRFAMAVHWEIMAAIISTAAFVALRYKVDILWVVLAGGALSALIL